MDENNTQQPGGFPNTTGYVNPQIGRAHVSSHIIPSRMPSSA